MRRRFFVDRFENQTAVMVDEAAHHLGRVLRAQTGQLYELSDGAQVWLARVQEVGRDHVDFALVEQLPAFQLTLRSTLLLAVVKFDVFEWALEKATELGVARVVPVAAGRSEKGLLAAAVKRAERWKKILLESSQQSRRVQVPQLEPLVTAEEAFALREDGLRILLSEAQDAKPLRMLLAGAQASSVTLAIGPEGGWTPAERAHLAETWTPVSLGGQILRAETAGIAALAILVNFWI